MTSIQLVLDTGENRRIFRDLFTDYAHYMNGIGADFWSVQTDGRIAPMGAEEVGDGVDDAFSLPGSYVYFINCERQSVGFAWITTKSFPYHRPDRDIYLAEFHIAQAFRRKGIGSQAFSLLLDYHHGEWVVGVLRSNEPALKFWTRTLEHVVTGRRDCSAIYQEDGEDDIRFRFTVSDLPSTGD